MKNPDVMDAKTKELFEKLSGALQANDDAAFADAFTAFAGGIQESVLQEYEQMKNVHDVSILAQRGVRQLTNEETKYYHGVINAMRSGNPKQALADMDVVMPKTIIDDVFSDLETSHPLLSIIDFQYGRGVTEWLMNANTSQLATWSPLCAEIVTELTSGFRKLDVAQNKLSAFLPVCKAMLDLGPTWLDRYVRVVFREALALGLEGGILNGRGQTANISEPTGMRKDLSGSVSPTTGYPDKTAIAFTSFNPTAFGALLSQLAKTENGSPRIVENVVMVVNPTDYLTKVFPATTVRTTDGGYNTNVLPFPTTIIQSTQIEEGKAILGIADRYLMVSGTGQSGVIEYSDHYHFLEDERVYLTKFYGHGQPKDNGSFLLLDISDLEPEVLDVRVVNAADFPSA